MLTRVLLALAGLGLSALTACTSAADPGTPPDHSGGRTPAAEACGPPTFDDVRGRVPHYLERKLTRFPNDSHLCAGLWLPRSMADFTPQGLAVDDGRTAFVSGYDGGGGLGTRFCRVLKVDLRTGRLLDDRAGVEGRVGSRPPVVCRHGGGMLLDAHGLWLVETDRLWLLDPDSLEVQRAWALIEPVRGSFAVHDGGGRLGLGGFKRERRDRLHWFEPADVLAAGVLDLATARAVGSQRVPPRSQGAVWGDLGPGPAGLWVASSHTYCGVLAGPRRVRRGFIPGAEGLVLDGDRLWVLSESATRPYQREGHRPVVPMLARFDVTGGIGGWAKPACTP